MDGSFFMLTIIFESIMFCPSLRVKFFKTDFMDSSVTGGLGADVVKWCLGLWDRNPEIWDPGRDGKIADFVRNFL